MKYLISFLLTIILGHGLFAQQSGEGTEAKKAEGKIKLEINSKMRILRNALLDRDSMALVTLLADDVTYGHSNGMVQKKAELIRDVMTGRQDYSKIEVRKMNIRIFENTAIVNLESDVSLVMDGKSMDLDMDILLVWVRQQGEWKLVARQSVKNS